MSFYSATGAWSKSEIDTGPPYTVWQAPKMAHWWTVLDRNGINVLTNGTGAVFTDEALARALADEWA
jgi:hypothetical protein